MKKRNIMYIAISVICVVSVILGVYYQIFADKVVDEGAVNTITNVWNTIKTRVKEGAQGAWNVNITNFL